MEFNHVCINYDTPHCVFCSHPCGKILNTKTWDLETASRILFPDTGDMRDQSVR